MAGFPDAAAQDQPMTEWREQSLWSKVGVLAALAFLMLIPGYSDAAGLAGAHQAASGYSALVLLCSAFSWRWLS